MRPVIDSPPNIRSGKFEIEARARVMRILIWIATMAVPIYFVYELAPLLDQEVTVARALSSSAYRSAEKEALESVKAQGGKKLTYFEYPASELTTVSIEIAAYGEEMGSQARHLSTQVKVRSDRLVLWVGTFAVLIAVMSTLLPSVSSLRIGSPRITRPGRLGGEMFAHTAAKEVSSMSPVELFSRDVESAGRRADALFARSTLLLTGGIIMAFIGVAIFYVTLPETKGEETLATYWPKVVRPTGVLVFVEAIAWFLLRQYRSLVEDYKWFYRLYLKRSNFLAASRVLSVEKVRPEDLFIAVSLVQEDYSGRLRAGETTEALEALKLLEDGPVSEALKALSSLRDKPKPERPKDGAEKIGA